MYQVFWVYDFGKNIRLPWGKPLPFEDAIESRDSLNGRYAGGYKFDVMMLVSKGVYRPLNKIASQPK